MLVEIGAKRKDLGAAGNKDRRAITKQYISVKNAKEQKIESLNLKDIKLTFIGKRSDPISLGDNVGNKFELVVRNISKKPTHKNSFINYFGEQRFSKNNYEVGLHILKGEYKKAVKILITGNGDYEELIKLHLEKQPTDFVGAFKKIPYKLQKLLVHSVQAKIFNTLAKKFSSDETIFRNSACWIWNAYRK